jgi:hypothetical protein
MLLVTILELDGSNPRKLVVAPASLSVALMNVSVYPVWAGRQHNRLANRTAATGCRTLRSSAPGFFMALTPFSDLYFDLLYPVPTKSDTEGNP